VVVLVAVEHSPLAAVVGSDATTDLDDRGTVVAGADLDLLAGG
jgi:hypothetical protein